MSALLSSPLFEFVPPTNIQTLFSRFEPIICPEGTSVITQGEPGGCFYVIQSGEARVERVLVGRLTPLAKLGPGDTFGQDALVSEQPRNATVTMTSSGVVMRLSAADFQSLLMTPIIETVKLDEIQGEQTVCIVDVRTTDEFLKDAIPGSQSLPLDRLRASLDNLDRDAIHVMTSKKDKRAALGAYILNEHGLTAYVLDH